MVENVYNERSLDNNNKSKLLDTERFFQIDILKAAMIFLVIFDHFVAWSLKDYLFVSFWERISIPVFLVIMGFNMGKSLQKQGNASLRELYSWKYFKGKIKRYIIPFLVLYGVSTFFGLYLYEFNFEAMLNAVYFPDHGIINLFTGYFLFWGPGNWFLPLLFQSILIIPLLYKGFQKNPALTLSATFAIEILMHVIVFFVIGDITTYEEIHLLTVFTTSILTKLSAIGLGLWLSKGYKPFSIRNLYMWGLFVLSFMWIFLYTVFGARILINGVWFPRGDYNFMFFPYSAFLVLLALNYLPRKGEGRLARGITMISNSTYHIFLIQMFGFGIINAFWGTHYGMGDPFFIGDLLDLLIIMTFFITFGILWYKIDRDCMLKRRILFSLNLFMVFVMSLIFTTVIQGGILLVTNLIIMLYSLGVLIFYTISRKPIKTETLMIWTAFVLITFITNIFEYYLYNPSFLWLYLVLVAIYLGGAVLLTITI